MRYGLTRSIDIYDYENETGETFVAPASSWFKATNWLDAHADELEGVSTAGPYENYVWAYYGLVDANKADKYGLKEPKCLGDIVDMASKVAVSFNEPEADSLPLKEKRPKSS